MTSLTEHSLTMMMFRILSRVSADIALHALTSSLMGEGYADMRIFAYQLIASYAVALRFVNPICFCV